MELEATQSDHIRALHKTSTNSSAEPLGGARGGPCTADRWLGSRSEGGGAGRGGDGSSSPHSAETKFHLTARDL